MNTHVVKKIKKTNNVLLLAFHKNTKKVTVKSSLLNTYF